MTPPVAITAPCTLCAEAASETCWLCYRALCHSCFYDNGGHCGHEAAQRAQSIASEAFAHGSEPPLDKLESLVREERRALWH